MKKLFISQPMRDKTQEEILNERNTAIQAAKEALGDEIEVIESYFPEYNPSNGCIPLKYLSKAIELLADADIAYFCSGWESARGCKIEHACAHDYGIKILYAKKNKQKHKLVFLTGAGISVASGIPTFEDQPDLRNMLDREFALKHPDEYRNIIAGMKETCDNAKPNAAHYAIAEMNCPVITMNIDGLHRKAGTKTLIEMHGRLPNDDEIKANNLSSMTNIPVLYGDPAPEYKRAYGIIKSLEYGNSYLVIVGTSFYTQVSTTIKRMAEKRNAKIIVIDDNAEIKVPTLCTELKKRLGMTE